MPHDDLPDRNPANDLSSGSPPVRPSDEPLAGSPPVPVAAPRGLRGRAPTWRREQMDEARRLYVTTNLPFRGIAAATGVPVPTIQLYARRENWPRRARSFFGEVDPAHRRKMRHDKEASCFHASGSGSSARAAAAPARLRLLPIPKTSAADDPAAALYRLCRWMAVIVHGLSRVVGSREGLAGRQGETRHLLDLLKAAREATATMTLALKTVRIMNEDRPSDDDAAPASRSAPSPSGSTDADARAAAAPGSPDAVREALARHVAQLFGERDAPQSPGLADGTD
jgi:hypothetical protein